MLSLPHTRRTPCRRFLVLACVLICAARAYGADSPTVAAIGESGAQELRIENVDVQLEFSDRDVHIGTAKLVAWVERSLHIVAGYYGQFPTARLHIVISLGDGRGVQGGTTWGSPQALIRVRVGREVTVDELLHDWILVHEMIHLALPEVGRRRLWLAEGISTYVESVARAQAGNRTPADVWAEFVRAMPQGLPRSGDQGLDNTPTWGRTYWGGALFCLLADVEIRRQTRNEFGLQEALRAVANASSGMASEWAIDRVLSTGDAAVGGKVLQELYAQMKDTAVAPDLAALWRDLGVEQEGASVRLRDDASLAAIRTAITQRPR